MMRFVELNTEGDYTQWEDYKLSELVEGDFGRTLGELIMENESVRLWQLSILPRQRVAFMQHPQNYSWSCASGGMAVLANTNGRIDLYVFEDNDYGYVELKDTAVVTDIRNIGQEVLTLHILEYL